MSTSAAKESFLKDSSLIFHYLWKYKRWLGVGLSSLVLVDVLEVLPPYFLKESVDIIVDRRPIQLLIKIAVAYFGVAVVQSLCRYTWRMYLIRSSILAGRDLRNKYAQHLYHLSSSFFDRSRMGDLMSLATNDVDAVRMAIGTGLLVFADAVFYLLTVPVAMYLLSPKLTLLACLPLPLIPWLVLRNEKQVHERFKKVQESFGKISAVVQENLNGIRVVKAFAKEDQEIGKIRKVGEEYVELNLNLARVQSAIGPTLDFMMSTGMVIVLFVGGRSLILGEGSGSQAITLGTFVAFQRYIQKMVWPMAALGMAINYYQRAVSSSKRLNEIFYTSSDTPESKDPIVPGRLLGRIEFKNLSFFFPGSQNLVLKNINLVIEPGERVAFVGSIGSGKSALLSLVPRLYSVQRGMLFLDGIDIQDLSLSEIRKHIGYVSQEVFLFSETVFENVAFSLHEWSERKMDLSSIESSTRIASVHDEVLRLSSQYQTQLGERGVNLSGGQKQRLTVARAIAKQPSILILDDALSSVDVHTEEQILKNLKTRSGRNTELIAAHRISTVQNADKIVVLEKGEIIQVGTHHQLIQDIGKKSGQYWKVFEQQRLKEDLENYQNELSK